MFILEELNYLMFWSLQKRECTLQHVFITKHMTLIAVMTLIHVFFTDPYELILFQWTWYSPKVIYILNISVLTFFPISSNCAILSFVPRCQLKRKIIQHGKELSYFNKQLKNWFVLMVLEILIIECLVQHRAIHYDCFIV